MKDLPHRSRPRGPTVRWAQFTCWFGTAYIFGGGAILGGWFVDGSWWLLAVALVMVGSGGVVYAIGRKWAAIAQAEVLRAR